MRGMAWHCRGAPVSRSEVVVTAEMLPVAARANWLRVWIDWLMDRRARRLAARIDAWIPRGGRLADLGSGTGHNAQVFRFKFDSTVDEFDVADLHWVGPGPRILEGQHLPVADSAYDAVALLFVLQYAADASQLLTEARRVSTSQIVVIQSTYRTAWGRAWLCCRGVIWGQFAYQMACLAGILKGPACSLTRRQLYTREDLRSLFQMAGLRVIHFEPSEWPGLMISRDLFVLEPMDS